MNTYKIVISYDGTDFSGIAEQRTQTGHNPVRTIIGEIRPLISKVVQCNPIICVSGRTDKGVHARKQVLSVSLPDECIPLDCSRLKYVLNRSLNPEIIIDSIEEASQDFNARHCARSRVYRYFIANMEQIDFMLSRYSWHVPYDLDVQAMKDSMELFIGEKDFTSFCKKDDSQSHNIREVFSLKFININSFNSFIHEKSNILCIEIHANAFCWNMVRAIVGGLVEVGKANLVKEQLDKILKGKNRSLLNVLAPPQGLFLWDVYY